LFTIPTLDCGEDAEKSLDHFAKANNERHGALFFPRLQQNGDVLELRERAAQGLLGLSCFLEGSSKLSDSAVQNGGNLAQ
jgi:hypothetical protein